MIDTSLIINYKNGMYRNMNYGISRQLITEKEYNEFVAFYGELGKLIKFYHNGEE